MVAKVFYNQSCSICRAEINHYKKITTEELDFVDITDNEMAKVQTKSDAATLLRRMHVIENGIVYSGAKAFLILWSKIPRYRWLAKVLGLPVLFTLFHLTYEVMAFVLFVKNRKQLPLNK